MGSNPIDSLALPCCNFRHMLLILVISINVCISSPAIYASAAGNNAVSTVESNSGKKTTAVYIVYMGHHKNRDKDLLVAQHLELLSVVKGSNMERATESILYHYKYSFSGFAAVLTSDEADQLSRMEEVVSVFPSEELEFQTTRSWEFLGLVNGINVDNTSTYSSELWNLAKKGRDVIVAVVDSGIWPESESFGDEGMDELPPNFWRGECEEGKLFNSSNCNKKIIGARTFLKAFEEDHGPVESVRQNFKSARDAFGHGTHLAAIAGGQIVPNVSGFGPGQIVHGTATGGFPGVRLAIYKSCWFRWYRMQTVQNFCSSPDTLAAIDRAVGDGVDVISVSVASQDNRRPFYRDSVSLGGLHAMQAGVLVSAAGGNSGPSPGTASNLAPWIITSAASTTDRHLRARLRLGSGLTLEGESRTAFDDVQYHTYRLIRGRDALRRLLPADLYTQAYRRECQYNNTLDPTKVKDTIVICVATAGTDPYTQSVHVQQAGGVAMILLKDNSDPITNLQINQVPTITLPGSASLEVQRYYVLGNFRGSFPKATILPLVTTHRSKPSPIVAPFSSQGPNVLEPSVLKPDISAPGVNILSAWPEVIGPSSLVTDTRRTKYNIASGTSIACPHVSAVAALLKSIHPSWSPSAIKSAIMTTASHVDNAGEAIKGYERDSSGIVNVVAANPFLVGAGQVDPNKAVDPGLVYDATPDDYYEFICNIGYNETILQKMTQSNLTQCPQTLGQPNGLNQPYVVVDLSAVQTVKVPRKVTNVGANVSTYRAVVTSPTSLEIKIEPQILQFTEVGQTLTFEVNVSLTQQSTQNYQFGSLTWLEDDGHHRVTIPIIVKT